MFACLYVPDFPVQACLLAGPQGNRDALSQSALAVLDGPANLPRVFATNPAARAARIQIGMTKLQVETYGGITLQERSPAAEESAQNALVELAGTFSPQVEATCPGAVILDLAGTEKIFGPWAHSVQVMTDNAAVAGFDLRVAIAANPDTAFLAARGFSTSTIIPAGEEAPRLAALPVSILPISPEMLDILEGWGIRTFQAFAALPKIAIVERLGQEGLYLQQLARGQTRRPLLTVEENAEFVESFEFEDPVENLESLFFILNRLLQQLFSRLMAAARATSELRLTIELEVREIRSEQNGEEYKHEWKLPVPTQDKHLPFSLIRLHLEKKTFSAPIRRFTIEVIPIKPRNAQGNLFAPPSPETEKLEITLERICGVVGGSDEDGTACVGAPRLLDTHRPGAFTVEHFCSSAAPKFFPPLAPVTALRKFRPAIEASVQLSGKSPRFVHLWHRNRRVLEAIGPWAGSGNWWNSSIWRREEWDVLLEIPSGTGLFRIHCDLIRQQWFVDGIFD
jgi:protein ImuB